MDAKSRVNETSQSTVWTSGIVLVPVLNPVFTGPTRMAKSVLAALKQFVHLYFFFFLPVYNVHFLYFHKEFL